MESIMPNRSCISAIYRRYWALYKDWLIVVAGMNPRDRIPAIGIQGKDCAVHGYVVVLGKLFINIIYNYK